MTFEKIKQILCEEFEIDECDVSLYSNISSDLGLDSIDVVDLVMSIEDELMVEVPDEAFEDITTLGDLVKYIDENK